MNVRSVTKTPRTTANALTAVVAAVSIAGCGRNGPPAIPPPPVPVPVYQAQPQARQVARNNVRLALYVDLTGSLNEEQKRENLSLTISLLDYVPPGTEIGVFAFFDDGPPTPIFDFNAVPPDDLIEAAGYLIEKSPPCDGPCTFFGPVLDHARDGAKRAGKEGKRYKAVMVGDGLAADPGATREAAKRLAAEEAFAGFLIMPIDMEADLAARAHVAQMLEPLGPDRGKTANVFDAEYAMRALVALK